MAKVNLNSLWRVGGRGSIVEYDTNWLMLTLRFQAF